MATKTIVLTGAETAVDELNGTNAAIRNDGTDTIYASNQPGIVPGADGVDSIPAGGSTVVYGISGTVYLTGSGSALIKTSDYSENPFKASAQGGSGADEQARAAINAHAGNAEIHLTAERAQSAAAQVFCNPNLLTNPDFRINQRGSVSYLAAGSAFDRWILLTGGCYAEKVGGGVKIGRSDERSGMTLTQINVMGEMDLRGRTVTLSVHCPEIGGASNKIRVLADGGIICDRNILGESDSYTFVVPTDCSELRCGFYSAGSADYVICDRIKLEIGDRATPFVPPDPAAELAKCQRYYQIRSKGDIPAADLRPTMRTAPTVTQLADGNYAYSAEQ